MGYKAAGCGLVQVAYLCTRFYGALEPRHGTEAGITADIENFASVSLHHESSQGTQAVFNQLLYPGIEGSTDG